MSDIDVSRIFWAVGSSFNNSNDDKTNYFIENSIWFDGYASDDDDRNIKILNEIKKGDILLIKSSSTKGINHKTTFTKLKAIGIVIEKKNQYTFHIDWLNTNKLPIDFDNISYRKTIEKMRDDEMLKYAKEFINNYTKPAMNNQTYDKYINILKANHNIILTGAPGTGKTYLAKKIAESMGCSENEIGFVQFHPSYDYTDFVEGLRPKQDKNGNIGFERKDGVFKEFCKKAINYSKPKDIWNNLGEYIKSNIDIDSSTGTKKYHIDYFDDKQIHLSGPSIREKGYDISIFDVEKAYNSKLWERGQQNGNDPYKAALAKHIYETISSNNSTYKPFVFIIDEINRGEISKIFGELFYSIDPGYRGKNDKTLPLSQYHNLIPEGDIFKDGFYVPDNVYIIGTMNDIDRSVESMDFAFRRRFAFVEIKPEDRLSMLDELNESLKKNATNRLINLNKAISQIDGLSPAYHIGASYFLKIKNYKGDFKQLWDYHIEGLLREYLRGMRDADKKIEELKNAYDNESAPNN